MSLENRIRFLENMLNIDTHINCIRITYDSDNYNVITADDVVIKNGKCYLPVISYDLIDMDHLDELDGEYFMNMFLDTYCMVCNNDLYRIKFKQYVRLESGTVGYIIIKRIDKKPIIGVDVRSKGNNYLSFYCLVDLSYFKPNHDELIVDLDNLARQTGLSLGQVEPCDIEDEFGYHRGSAWDDVINTNPIEWCNKWCGKTDNTLIINNIKYIIYKHTNFYELHGNMNPLKCIPDGACVWK